MDNFLLQLIGLIALPIHSQKRNLFLAVGINGIPGPGSNPLSQMRNLAILGLINLSSGCPRLFSSSVLPSEDYAVAVVRDIEFFRNRCQGGTELLDRRPANLS